MEKKRNRKNRILSILLYILVGFVWVLSVAMLEGATHYAAAYSQVSFAELLFTLTAPMQGTSSEFARLVFEWVGVPALKALAAYIVVCLLLSSNRWTLAVARKLRLITEKYDLLVWLRRLGVLLVAFVFALGCRRGFWALKIGDYLRSMSEKSTIYEEEYVDPANVAITQNGKPRNLILIYLESMESAYADTESGGMQQGVNYIPHLTELAGENISFSTGDEMNGYHPLTKITWTMASLLASNSGVAYNFPLDSNAMSGYKTFASRLTTLGNLLEDRGYVQEFLCGSDATFGGRRNFFTQHGNYRIFDLPEAEKRGYMTKDDEVWWGFLDKDLFKYAKMELADLAQTGKPFNLTMLTVDLHHYSGYPCELCDDDPSIETTARVAGCTDRQIVSFIAWLQEQDFYENTTVVILGDHPRMDTYLVGDTPVLERGVYNCFINSAVTTDKQKNVSASTPDMFPTILAAMGYKIDGERLGLGTNLFSDVPTVTERRGLDWVNDQLGRFAPWFIEHFE